MGLRSVCAWSIAKKLLKSDVASITYPQTMASPWSFQLELSERLRWAPHEQPEGQKWILCRWVYLPWVLIGLNGFGQHTNMYTWWIMWCIQYCSILQSTDVYSITTSSGIIEAVPFAKHAVCDMLRSICECRTSRTAWYCCEISMALACCRTWMDMDNPIGQKKQLDCFTICFTMPKIH